MDFEENFVVQRSDLDFRGCRGMESRIDPRTKSLRLSGQPSLNMEVYQQI